MQTIEVTNCAECPFSQWDEFSDRLICNANMDLRFKKGAYYPRSIHPLCPLKTNQITVKLKDDENSKRDTKDCT